MASIEEKRLALKRARLQQARASASASFEPPVAEEPGVGDELMSGLKNIKESLTVGGDSKPFIERVPLIGAVSERLNDAGETLGTKAATGGKLSDIWDYVRKQRAEREAKAAQEHPISEGILDVGAGFAAPGIPNTGFTSAVAKAAPKLEGLASGIGNAVGSAGLAGADTAIRRGDLDQAEDTALNAGAISGGMSGLGLLGKGVKNLVAPRGLAAAADERAFKAATGQNTKAFKENYLANASNLGEDVDPIQFANRLQQTGRDLRKPDEAGAPVVGWFDNVAGIGKKAEAKQDFYGKKIGDVGKAAEEITPQSVSGMDYANNLKDWTDKNLPDDPNFDAVRHKIMSSGDRQANRLGMTWDEAKRLKKNFKFDPGDPATMAVGRQGTNAQNRAISDAMESAVERAKVSPNASPEQAELLGQYNPLKGKYGSYSTAATNSEDRVLKDMSNRWASPSDHAAAATGILSTAAGGMGAIGSGLTGAAAGLVNNQIRSRGNAFAARSLGALDSVLSSPAGQAYRGLFQQAAERGPTAIAVTHEMLLKNDENYRKLMESQGGAQ